MKVAFLLPAWALILATSLSVMLAHPARSAEKPQTSVTPPLASAPVALPTTETAPDAYAGHAQEKGAAEIDQRFKQGVAMLHAKRYEDAITAFHRLLALAPQMPEAHVNMGFALLGLQRYAAARDFFQSAIELRKEQYNAYYGLAEALEGLKEMPGALGAMRTYLHLAPADDAFRSRASAAIWEWEEQRDKEKNQPAPSKKKSKEKTGAAP